MSNIHFAITPMYIDMLCRFVLCMLTVWFIVDRLYFKKSHRRDFYFTFILIAVAIFFLVFFMIFVLEDLKAKTSIGIGIGLFGIFSIMRYRTDAMPVREMTYLFSIIAIAVVNAITGSNAMLELILTDAIFVLAIWLTEKVLKQEPAKLVQYDRIELIKPDRRKELIADLEARLGLKVLHVDVGSVDFLRDMAILKVYYVAEKADETIDSALKLSRDDLQNVK